MSTASIYAKFLATLVVAGLLAAGLGSWATYRANVERFQRTLVAKGDILARALRRSASAAPGPDQYQPLVETALEHFPELDLVVVAATDPREVLAATEPRWRSLSPEQIPDRAVRRELVRGLALGSPRPRRPAGDDGAIVTRRIAVWTPGGAPARRGVILLRVRPRTIDTAAASLLWPLNLIIVSATAAMLLATFLFNRIVLAPLARIRAAMNRQRAGDRSARAPETGNDEIAAVARNFNRMVRSIEESERRLEDFTEVASDWIWEIGADHRFMYVSDRVREIAGVTPETLLGKTALEAGLRIEDPQARRRQTQAVSAREPFHNIEYTWSREGERRRYLLASAKPIFDESGEFLGYRGSTSDISERKAVERALLESKEASDQAARAKSEFVASMSHELRTPMTGVLGVAELLLDTPLNSEQRDYAETIHRSADSLLLIFNDVLDFSKGEAGKLTVERTPIDLRNLMEDAIEVLAPRAHGKGVQIFLDYGPEVPRHLIGDGVRIRQVVTNLVSNAIKFTAEGHVLAAVNRIERGGERTEFEISVRDTGVGIPTDKLEHIFAEFTQADESTTRKYGGTGLGLAISRQLIEAMGGSVSVESEVGAGSTFRVVLPLEIDDGADSSHCRLSDLVGLRILCVDPSDQSRRLLREHLVARGMLVTGVGDAETALQRLRSAVEAGAPYQVAVIDQQLGPRGGNGLTGRIRSSPPLADIALVSLTIAGQTADAGPGAGLGHDAELRKPVRRSRLLEKISEALHARGVATARRSPGRPEIASTAPEAGPERRDREGLFNARVLVVEDNEVNQRVASTSLAKLGCDVDVAANGREALALVGAVDYDLILMDCQMPEMDGYEATTEIRRREGAGGRTPIIALTANAMEGDRDSCLAHGMDDYATKPVKVETLRQLLATWLGESRPAAPTPSADRPGGRVDDGAGTGQPLDAETIKELRSIVDDALEEVVESYLDDVSAMLNRMEQAIEAGDPDALRAAAHQLKSSSASVGALPLCEQFKQLEAMGRSGVLDGAPERLEEARRELARVEASFESMMAEWDRVAPECGEKLAGLPRLAPACRKLEHHARPVESP